MATHRLDSDDDDQTLQASDDDDVLKQEQDQQELLGESHSKSRIGKLFQAQDPNAPRPLHATRKEMRKQRRKERRARRRGRRSDDETALMFGMEEGDEKASDDSSSVSSTEPFTTSQNPRSVRRKLFHFALIPLALASLFGLLMIGAYRLSGEARGRRIGLHMIKSNGTSNFAPTTILISLDGFRADFLNRGLTPTLNSFIEQGVSPKYMLPSFPSVTFPNHWTLVTGLYPESHGVVGNTFWDPDLQEEFYYTDPARSMFPKWWTSTGAEPIWSTAERQGVKSAIHMWPGSEAHIQLEPTYLDKYNGTEILSKKVSRVFELLDLPSDLDEPIAAEFDRGLRPQFVGFYVPNVDQDGHRYGPNSTEIRKTISAVDLMLGKLFSGLQQRNLTGIVNVVVVSDHGMATTSNDRLIQLEDLMNVEDIEHIDGWPLYGLRPKANINIIDLYHKLESAAKKQKHFEVYLRENMPARWHFSENDRIAPIWLIPETGWAIVHKADFDVEAARKAGTIYHPRGLHGYDHEHPLMRAIFVARGPAFPHKPNSQLAVFQNTEVYNIVCDSLGIEPRPNNGTLRLPLKPIGIHTATPPEETPIDLPSSIGGTSAAATVEPSPTSTPEPAPEDEDDEEPKDDADDSTDEKENEHDNGHWWDVIVDKIEDVKDWVSDLFGSKNQDQQDQDRK